MSALDGGTVESRGWQAVPPPYEGAYAEDLSEAWFPRDGVGRDEARKRYFELADMDGLLSWVDVRVLRAWCRFDPDAHDFDGSKTGLWFPCERDEEAAVPAWHVIYISRAERRRSRAPQPNPDAARLLVRLGARDQDLEARSPETGETRGRQA